MAQFVEINYDLFLDYMEEAKANDTRIRVSDGMRWRRFIMEHNIDMSVIERKVKSLGTGCKMTIISSGSGQGFYLYSWDTINPNSNYCYRYV